MIGNYDMSKMRDPSNLIWVDLTRSITPYWQSSIGNIRIGNEEYRLSVDYTAIFDSGTSQIILPYCKVVYFHDYSYRRQGYRESFAGKKVLSNDTID